MRCSLPEAEVQVELHSKSVAIVATKLCPALHEVVSFFVLDAEHKAAVAVAEAETPKSGSPRPIS